jgi:glycosyl transferase family 87
MLKRSCYVLGSLLLAGAMWLWVQNVAIARQQAEAAERGIPRGNLSDLYPRWLGARELLLRGRDPYRDDITREIQTGYYGRPIDPSRPNDPTDQQAFAYPLYVVFVLAPTVGLPFAVVQRGFLWLLIALTAASVLLWFRALEWRTSVSTQVIWIILTLASFPAIQGIKLQQLSLLVAALIAASMYAVARRRLVWAGILLALASIKPQLVFLLAIWLLLWASGKWRERQRLVWSFTLTMACLVIGGEVLLPGWIREFRNASAAYYQYTGGGRSVLDVLLTPTLGRIVAAILVAVLMIFLWRTRRADEGSADFHWSLALVMAVTLAVIPMFAPYNQLLLLSALMLVVRAIRPLWETSRMSRFFVAVAAVLVAWPWVAAAGLAIGLLFLPAAAVQRAWTLPLYTSQWIPIAVAVLLLVGRNVLGSEAATRIP